MEGSRLQYYRNWLAFFTLGTLNNLPYVLVNSSGRVLASSFHTLNLLPLILFANVAFGFVAKGGNTLLTLTRFPFWIRFFINGCLMIAGLIGVAFSPNFWIALASIVVVGFSSSFGEGLTLGYLSFFPKGLISAWSSGTGLAGLLGAVLYLLLACIAMHTVISHTGSYSTASPTYLNELREINKFVFLGSLPLILLYWFAYFVLIRKPHPPSSTIQQSGDTHDTLQRNDETTTLIRPETPPTVTMVTKERAPWRVLRCFKLTLWLSVNLAGVYIFEYVCRGFAAKARSEEEYLASEVNCPELYASLQLCYQAGVFASRSSLSVVHIRRVWILTVLQLLNMILWMLQAWWKFIPVYLLPALMVYVGLLGGASYVNIFYMIRSDGRYPTADRELCTNIAAMWITLGILVGALFQLGFFETIYSDK